MNLLSQPLDISPAFDSLDPLDHSTCNFNIPGRPTAFSWLSSFVSDRKQYNVTVDEQSSLANGRSCVLQGSVLCALLFAT